jgi:RNA polymerase sigma-70 factor, ECF subfamily
MTQPSERAGIQIDELWAQMEQPLCRFVCSRLADTNDAEDVLQEVFLRAQRSLGSLREKERLESWMYQIARNKIIDTYRARRELGELSETIAEEALVEESPAEDLTAHVRKLVQTLPEAYREAILLTEYEGLSQKELAERLGISFSGAKSRVQRARQKIKEALLACCRFEFDPRGNILDYHARCCG